MSSDDSQVTNIRRRFHEIESTERPEGPSERDLRLSFGPFVLEADSGRLLEGDRQLPLAPKPFETLIYLAARPGKVVSKADLMKAIWPDTFVTDDVLVQCVVDIRRALGDHPKTPQFVETLPRRGYRFVASVGRLTASGPAEALPQPPAQPEIVAPPRSARGRRHLALGALVLSLGVPVGLLVWNAMFLERGGAPASVVPGSLAVLPFRVEPATAETEWLGPGLAELLRGQFGQRPEFQLVARHRVAGALKDEGEAMDDPRGASASRVARALGAERHVAGSLVRVRERFVLDAEMVNEQTGAIEGRARAEGRWPADLMTAVDDQALKLQAQGDADAFRPMRAVTRSSEAYRLYVEALGFFFRGGRHGAEQAQRRLDDAVRLDPRFAYAYLKKAEIDEYLRRWGYGDVDPMPAVRAAAALATDLPERDRKLVELLEAQLRDDGEATLRLGDSLQRFYPAFAAEAGVPVIVADLLYRQGRWDDLILAAEPRVDSPALPGTERAHLSSLLSKAFRQKGEFERALVHARRAAQLWPVSAGPSLLRQRTDLGRACFEAGRRPEALAELRAVAAAPEADATNLTNAAWGLYMAHEVAEARALVERALRADAEYGNAHHLKGWLLLARGEAAEAARSFETAFEKSPRSFGAAHHGFVRGDVPALYYAGVAWQQAGDESKARSTFARVMKLCERAGAERGAGRGAELQRFQAASLLAIAAARLGRSVPDPARLQGDDATYFLQAARLHAVQGRREPALRELRQALSLGPGERQHVRDDPNFEALRSDPEFQQLVGS